MRTRFILIIVFFALSCGCAPKEERYFSFLKQTERIALIKKYATDSIVLRPAWEEGTDNLFFDLNYDKLYHVDSLFYYKYLIGRNEFCPYTTPRPQTNECGQFFYGLITNLNTGHSQLLIFQNNNRQGDFIGEWFILNFDEKEELVDIFPAASIQYNYRNEVVKSSILLNHSTLNTTICKQLFEKDIVDIDNNRYFRCVDSINVRYKFVRFRYQPEDTDSIRVCNWIDNSS